MNKKPFPFGGWFVSAAEELSNYEGIELVIAFPDNKINRVIELNGEKIKYYLFPSIKNKENDVKNNIFLNEIITKYNPEIVHIFGTEYPHTLAMVNACNKKEMRVIISIQGLTSIIAKHYLAGLPIRVQKRFMLRDFLKQDNLRQQQRKFIERGKLEIEALKKVKYVIGRTTWDKACAYQINPDAKYYHCNETLRDEFYKHTWDINQCEKHSIFVSQGSYPIKGLHFMLEAMPLILERFPETKLYIGGQNIIKSDTLKNKIKITSYGKYIKELINKYNLNGKVFFTGILDEKRMCERYLKSHIFVSPSLVENESNSLSEAKLLGVPCVASYVGGVIDRIEHGIDGFFYQYDAPYMLAHYIYEIFKNKNLTLKLSKNAREHAVKTHDRKANKNRLIIIYNTIISENISKKSIFN